MIKSFFSCIAKPADARATPYPVESGVLTKAEIAHKHVDVEDWSNKDVMLLVKAAFDKVCQLTERITEPHPDTPSLLSLHQVAALLSEDWPGSFARVHIVSHEHAMLAVAQPAIVATASARTAAALIPLCAAGTALSTVVRSHGACFSWVRQHHSAPPTDYASYIAAGACAIHSAAIKLSDRSSVAAILTFGFPDGVEAAHPALRGLWPGFVKLLASAMSVLCSHSLPCYISLALDLRVVPDLDSAISTSVNKLYELPIGNPQLTFRVALVLPSSNDDACPSSAVLFDILSEACSTTPHPSARSEGCRRMHRMHSRLGGCAQSDKVNPFFRSETNVSSAAGRNGRSGSGAGVQRTVVSTDSALLRHALADGGCVVTAPNIQKLINQGKWIASDIFSISSVRPPVSAMLLPLSTCKPGGKRSCFGAIYVMSTVPTDLSVVRAQLEEAVAEIVAPHLAAALARPALAAELASSLRSGPGKWQQLYFSSNGHSRVPAGSQIRLEGVLKCSSMEPQPPPTSSSATRASSSPRRSSIVRSGRSLATEGLVLALDSKDSLASSEEGGLLRTASSVTNALVTGLTDKINSHRLTQSLLQDGGTKADFVADLELLDLLGLGGYGFVFLGKWRCMPVAVKVVNTSGAVVKRANSTVSLKHAHEIAILSTISHPNVVQAYSFMTDLEGSDVLRQCVRNLSWSAQDNAAFLRFLNMESCHIVVLEFCDRKNLCDAMATNCFQYAAPPDAAARSLNEALGDKGVEEPWPRPATNISALLATLSELAGALAHLHGLGIVHCDIKPDNVLLKSSHSDVRGFSVKLADFGLSRVEDEGCLTFPSNSCGTIAYAAPEAMRRERCDRSIDVYSFGILMHELYYDERPFAHMTKETIFKGVARRGLRPRFLPGSHPGYAQLAEACWDSVPANRPQMDEVVRALSNMLALEEQECSPLSSHLPSPASCRHQERGDGC